MLPEQIDFQLISFDMTVLHKRMSRAMVMQHVQYQVSEHIKSEMERFAGELETSVVELKRTYMIKENVTTHNTSLGQRTDYAIRLMRKPPLTKQQINDRMNEISRRTHEINSKLNGLEELFTGLEANIEQLVEEIRIRGTEPAQKQSPLLDAFDAGLRKIDGQD